MNAICTWWSLTDYLHLRSKGYQSSAELALVASKPAVTATSATAMAYTQQMHKARRAQQQQQQVSSFQQPRFQLHFQFQPQPQPQAQLQTSPSKHLRQPQRMRLATPLLTFGALPCFVLLCLLIHCIKGAATAPQSCVLCDNDELEAKNSDQHETHENFFFEHQVTRQDAINALKNLNNSFYDGPPECLIRCSDKVMRYCLGQQFINDHCWCELGHINEGLPFVPHICYVGEKVYKASVGSCYFYEEVKECCCAPALAKQWRYISKASRQIANSSPQLLCKLLLVLLVIGHRLRGGI